MAIHLVFQDQEVEIDVEPDIELDDLLDCVRILGLCDVSQLEQYDEELGKWMTVNETRNLNLRNGAKFKVRSRPKVVCITKYVCV